jgi:hypothetical protein
MLALQKLTAEEEFLLIKNKKKTNDKNEIFLEISITF